MYFSLGWPKIVNFSSSFDYHVINHVCCDAVKILVASVSDDVLSVWYLNPLIPISFHRRSNESIENFGPNKLITWKPDSQEIAILTERGAIILYKLRLMQNETNILQRVDPHKRNQKREPSELFVKENIPCLRLVEHCVYELNVPITAISCISLTELLIATTECQLIRLLWTDLNTTEVSTNEHTKSNLTTINLRNVPFYVKQTSSAKLPPTLIDGVYIVSLEYSPFIGGCAAVFNDNRAAVLIAANFRFETQNIHGFWLPDADNVVTCSVNHKFRLVAFGQLKSDVIVYAIEDATGALEYSHRLTLDSGLTPRNLGSVSDIKWSPDGCVLAVAWQLGGIALWSTFGTLLMSSFDWDFGLNIDISIKNPLAINKLDWSTEGYQLFLTCKSNVTTTNVLQLNFVKSALSTNPSMTSQPHILLQGNNTLYLIHGGNLDHMYTGLSITFPNTGLSTAALNRISCLENFGMEIKKSASNVLSQSKHWIVLQLPLTYSATNLPIRYAAVDTEGVNLAVAGRTGIAHFSLFTRKWKVFGNESQEKDFVVSGGLTYYKDFIILGCYSLLEQSDEIRCYPVKKKLDNEFGNKIQVRAPVIALSRVREQLIILTADGIIHLFALTQINENSINMESIYEFDVKNICIHPACIVSLTITHVRKDVAEATKELCISECEESEAASEAIIVNVSGRVLMIKCDYRTKVITSLKASCLASCVECFWTSEDILKSPMHEALWLYSGGNGMRVWLPILPSKNQAYNTAQHLHTFMSKRIMLSFPLKIYPLVILFDDVIALGVENETTLYCNEVQSHFSLPFCIIEKKLQVYLHKILRQLIKRNLGYSAWEIAKSCRTLPYFFHSLELLLHEVLEDEATSKEPIPDALLPSILNFIREFPFYLRTVVQCARKTEIALWPYLFSIAGKPKDLFQQCLQLEELETAAGFLVILQNLEPSFVSKQYAIILLDISIKKFQWELAKDLIRFLNAIDPNEIDSPRSSMIVNVKIAPPALTESRIAQNAESFNMVLGPISRERRFSTASSVMNLPKDKKEKTITAAYSIESTGSSTNSKSTNETVLFRKMPSEQKKMSTAKDRRETFCIDTILQQHARNLLKSYKLLQLGYMSAYLDFHLVSWLSHEVDSTTQLDDYIIALKGLHKEFKLSSVGFVDMSKDLSILTGFEHHQHHHHQQELLESPSTTSDSGYFSVSKLSYTSNAYNNELNSFASNFEDKSRFKKNLTNKCFNSRNNNKAMCLNDYNHEHDDDDLSNINEFEIAIENHCDQKLPEKLLIKIRYLLQLFIEANCIDYALVLSILLKDAGSVSRIINGIIRSESTIICCRVYKALKRLIQWIQIEECVYKTFLDSLQPYISLLEQYLITSEKSIAGNLGLSSRTRPISESEISDNKMRMLTFMNENCLNSVDLDKTYNVSATEQQQKALTLPRLTKKENITQSSNKKISSVKESNACRIM